MFTTELKCCSDRKECRLRRHDERAEAELEPQDIRWSEDLHVGAAERDIRNCRRSVQRVDHVGLEDHQLRTPTDDSATL